MRNTFSFFLAAIALAWMLAGCKLLSFQGGDSQTKTGETTMEFAGLVDGDAVFVWDDNTPGDSYIAFTWDRATKATGKARYTLYADVDYNPDFLIGVTDQTTFRFTPEVSGNGCFAAKTYNFVASARDTVGTVRPDSYASVIVRDKRSGCLNADSTPPVFEGVKLVQTASHTAQTVKWTPSPSTDINRYEIYFSHDLVNPIGTTVRNYFIVKNLSPATPYEYVVRARDGAGNVETNVVKRSDTTFNYAVPSFDGITGLERLTGVGATDSMRLIWVPVSGVAGYRIFRHEGATDDFLTPMSVGFTQVYPENGDPDPYTGSYYVPQPSGQLVSSAIVKNLSPGQSYTFVVQTFSTSSGVVSEANRVDRTLSTAPLVPVTNYGGATSAVAANGEAGFDQINVNFSTPASTGVWNGFRVEYGDGPCSVGATYPYSLFFGDDSLTQASITANIVRLQRYHFRVKARYEIGVGSFEDDNTTCVSAVASPPPPVFSGINSLVIEPGVAGFTTLRASWLAATGSFTEYLVTVSTSPTDFSNPFLVLNRIAATALGDQQTTSISIPGLEPLTTYYVKVTAVYRSLDGLTTLEAGGTPVRSASTTPLAPSNTRIDTVTVQTPDSVLLKWNEPTTPSGAVFSHYRIWKVCAPTPSSNIVQLLNTHFNNGDNTSFYNGDTTSFIQRDKSEVRQLAFTGLTSDNPCGFYVRSVYQDGSLVMKSTEGSNPGQPGAPIYITPTVTAPAFNELSAEVLRPQPESTAGFSTVQVRFTPISADEVGSFGRYQIAYKNQTDVAPNTPEWTLEGSSNQTKGTISSTVPLNGTIVVNNLKPKASYKFWIRVVNDNYSTTVVRGGTTAISPGIIRTEPPAPRGDEFRDLNNAGSTRVTFKYKSPSGSIDVGGLWNNIFVFVVQKPAGGTQASDVSNAVVGSTALEQRLNDSALGILSSEITAVMPSSRTITLASPDEALVQIPRSLSGLTPGAEFTFTIGGLTVDKRVCVLAVAVNWVSGDPLNQFLRSGSIPSPLCATPAITAPSFPDGVTLSGNSDPTLDFNNLTVTNLGPVNGECDRIEIYTADSIAGLDQPAALREANVPCSSPSYPVAGGTQLTADTDYYVRVRAVGQTDSVWFPSETTAMSRRTLPPPPEGGRTNSLTRLNRSRSLDQITLSFTTPVAPAVDTGGPWNNIYVYRATSTASENAARADVDAKVGGDPSTNVWRMIPRNDGGGMGPATTTTTIDEEVRAGEYTCYVALGVYSSGSNFSRANYTNTDATSDVKCSYQPFVPPNIGRITTAVLESGNDVWNAAGEDGTAKIRLNLFQPPTGDVEDILIYYRPDGPLQPEDFDGEPWQVVQVGPNKHQPASNSQFIYVGGEGRTVATKGYFGVRANFVGGATVVDVNTVSAELETAVPSNRSNYVRVAAAESGLGYDYYMMTYEASLSAVADTATAPTVDSNDLRRCNQEFHSGSLDTIFSSSCGIGTAITQTASSKPLNSSGTANVPSTATFAQAWQACRNTSIKGLTRTRLPTEEEWRRAARWGAGYDTMWSTYTTSCNATSNAIRGGGASSASCKSRVGAFDVAGNVREWVDARMQQYNINSPPTGSSQSRFNFGPNIGMMFDNGIDGLTRRFYLIDPDTSVYALQMGSDFLTTSPSGLKQYDAESERWTVQTTSNSTSGFRCVTFFEASKPTVEQLALPTEPVYTGADRLANEIPEGRFEDDVKIERVAITVDPGGNASTSSGKVRISWKPWSKRYWDGSAYVDIDSSLFDYEVWRFVEPLRRDIRPTTTWGLDGGTSASQPYNEDPLGGGVPLDPLHPKALEATAWVKMLKPTSMATTSVSGSVCNAADPSACYFEDDTSKAFNDFNPLRFYSYVVVVKDDAGNRYASRQQKFNSPFFTGAPLASGAPGFRSELRLRQAGVFMVDEPHQVAVTGSPRQVLAYVPMDKSGHDRDLFVQKYESSVWTSSGNSWVIESGASSYHGPFFNYNSNTWRDEPGRCHDSLLRGAGFNTSICGTAVNAAVLESLPGQTAQTSQPDTGAITGRYGAFYRGCRNSFFADGDGNNYYLHMTTTAEWRKAADYGNTSLVGGSSDNINDGPRAGGTVSDLKTACALNAGDARLTGSDTNCTSRYGVVDMAGNIMEYSADRYYAGTGLDNGIDALQLGVAPTQNVSNSSNTVDLIRGVMVAPSQQSSINLMGEFGFLESPNGSTQLTSMFLGGRYRDPTGGRWYSRFFWEESHHISPGMTDYIGARCAY